MHHSQLPSYSSYYLRCYPVFTASLPPFALLTHVFNSYGHRISLWGNAISLRPILGRDGQHPRGHRAQTLRAEEELRTSTPLSRPPSTPRICTPSTTPTPSPTHHETSLIDFSTRLAPRTQFLLESAPIQPIPHHSHLASHQVSSSTFSLCL